MIRRQFCRKFAAAGAALVAAPLFGFSTTSVTATEPKAPAFPLPATSPVGPGARISGNWVPNANLWFRGGRGTHRIVEVNSYGIWYVPDNDLQVVVFQPREFISDDGMRNQTLVCKGNLYFTESGVKRDSVA